MASYTRESPPPDYPAGGSPTSTAYPPGSPVYPPGSPPTGYPPGGPPTSVYYGQPGRLPGYLPPGGSNLRDLYMQHGHDPRILGGVDHRLVGGGVDPRLVGGGPRRSAKRRQVESDSEEEEEEGVQGFSNAKTILVIAIVVGCFAVLWPKIFYPMLFGHNDSGKFEEDIRQERVGFPRPGGDVHPALKERGRMGAHPGTGPTQEERIPPPVRTVEKEWRDRGGPMPGMRPNMGGPGIQTQQSKGGGSMGVIMPIYTVGIIIFFLYTTMKIMFKNKEEDEDDVQNQRKKRNTYNEDYSYQDYKYDNLGVQNASSSNIGFSYTKSAMDDSPPPYSPHLEENPLDRRKKVEFTDPVVQQQQPPEMETENGAAAMTAWQKKVQDISGDTTGEVRITSATYTSSSSTAAGLSTADNEVLDKNGNSTPSTRSTASAPKSPADRVTDSTATAPKSPADRATKSSIFPKIPDHGNKDMDPRDVEISMLKRRLEETERAMERIVEQMGAVTSRLSPLILAQAMESMDHGKDSSHCCHHSRMLAEAKEKVGEAVENDSERNKEAKHDNAEEDATQQDKKKEKESPAMVSKTKPGRAEDDLKDDVQNDKAVEEKEVKSKNQDVDAMDLDETCSDAEKDDESEGVLEPNPK